MSTKNGTAHANLPTETLRARRGHGFYPPVNVREATPELDTTDAIASADKIVQVHYFGGSADWYIVEADWSTGEAFGYADLGLGGGEWGSIYLPEIEAVNVHRGMLIMERDCHFDQQPFDSIQRR